MFDWRRFLESVNSAHIDNIGIAVPYEFNRGKGVIPAEIHPTDTRPMGWKIAMLDSNLGFFDREDPAAA
jgi:hypothetical protein